MYSLAAAAFSLVTFESASSHPPGAGGFGTSAAASFFFTLSLDFSFFTQHQSRQRFISFIWTDYLRSPGESEKKMRLWCPNSGWWSDGFMDANQDAISRAITAIPHPLSMVTSPWPNNHQGKNQSKIITFLLLLPVIYIYIICRRRRSTVIRSDLETTVWSVC